MSSRYTRAVPFALLLALAACKQATESGPNFPNGPGDKRRPGSFGPPELGPVVKADKPPPPISGGTLLTSANGRWAVASDSDRDQIHIVDLDTDSLHGSIALNEYDEPGRLVEDDLGRVHVVLRRGGAIVSLGLDADAGKWQLLSRRPVCAVPRGIDHDSGKLYIACAEGALVVLPADPLDGVAIRIPSVRDIRDVAVTSRAIFLTRFRSGEIVILNRDGEPLEKAEQRVFSMAAPTKRAATEPRTGVAWRMRKRGNEVLVLLQRANTEGVSIEAGGYSGGGGCGGLVSPGMVVVDVNGSVRPAATFVATVLAVDFALSADSQILAMVAPGNALTPGLDRVQVQLHAVGSVLQLPCISAPGAPSGFTGPVTGPTGPPPIPVDAAVFPAPDPGVAFGDAGAADGAVSEAGILPPPEVVDFAIVQPDGVAIAVALDRRGRTLVQLREPAQLVIANANANKRISLSDVSRADTGHDIFHSNAGAGIACASCHPEGGEDSQVWNFDGIGPRRTQSLRGGIMNTKPFHWDGDLSSMDKLMSEVFQKRMSGPVLSADQIATLAHWVDGIPAMPQVAGENGPSVVRGQALFRGAAGCNACHAGQTLTNNQSIDVGTGGPFQVPSLRGLVWRAPYMHNGCAREIRHRLEMSGCGGDGDAHGSLSKLTPSDVDDLTAYLESL